MKLVITGINGFVGQHLKQFCIQNCIDYIGLKREKYEIFEEEYFKNIDVTKGDIIVHLANKSFVPESWENPKEYFNSNLIGTLNVLEYCKKNELGLIYLSSYMYGDPDYFPIDENHEVKANNPYALSKKMCEELISFYGKNFNVGFNILRPFNIYGKGQKDSYLIPTIVKQVKSELKEIILNDVTPKRDFIHINDIVDAIMLCSNKLDNEIYNLCSGKSISIGELCKLVIELSNSNKEIKSMDITRKNEILDCYGSFEKIRQNKGWTPKISLTEGITEYFN